jgi:hypothetical protein
MPSRRQRARHDIPPELLIAQAIALLAEANASDTMPIKPRAAVQVRLGCDKSIAVLAPLFSQLPKQRFPDPTIGPGELTNQPLAGIRPKLAKFRSESGRIPEPLPAFRSISWGIVNHISDRRDPVRSRRQAARNISARTPPRRILTSRFAADRSGRQRCERRMAMATLLMSIPRFTDFGPYRWEGRVLPRDQHQSKKIRTSED